MGTNSNDSFSNSLARALMALERRRRRFMNMALEADGIKDIPYRYITTIKHHPGASQDFLAEFFGVNKSHVARKLRELEVAGLVSREPVPNNRRQYSLYLTDEGNELYLIIRKHADEWEALITSGIDENEMKTTSQTIRRIVENIDGGKI